MDDEGKMKKCAYFLVRYVPDIVRDEGLNIGLFLHSPEQEYLDCLFTEDFSRIKRLHPQADLEFLRELQPYFEQQIREHENNLEGYIQEMRDSFSNLIQVTEPRLCLASDLPEEMQSLFARYVGERLQAPLRQDTRMRIKQALTDALDRAGVLKNKQFEKQIPAEPWTQKGDPFRFDFGYRPLETPGLSNGHIKLIHALSLRRDPDLADRLSLKIQAVRAKEPAELTAVVEALPAPGDETASYSYRVLLERQIVLQPVEGVSAYAQSVRRELQL